MTLTLDVVDAVMETRLRNEQTEVKRDGVSGDNDV